jgi:hypothetical protein
MLDRRIEELLDLGEGDDLVEFAFDLDAAHAEDRAVQEDVFATVENLSKILVGHSVRQPKSLELYGFARRDWGKKIRKVARKTVKLSTLFAADRSFRATRSRNSGGARMSASRASKARF